MVNSHSTDCYVLHIYFNAIICAMPFETALDSLQECLPEAYDELVVTFSFFFSCPFSIPFHSFKISSFFPHFSFSHWSPCHLPCTPSPLSYHHPFLFFLSPSLLHLDVGQTTCRAFYQKCSMSKLCTEVILTSFCSTKLVKWVNFLMQMLQFCNIYNFFNISVKKRRERIQVS